MKLLWIEFENLQTGLKIERVEFNKDITLLVGLSGVGKTQILNAIEYSLKLAVDKDIILRPFYVNLGVNVDNDIYEWTYKIENIVDQELTLDEEDCCFTYEKLLCNDNPIFTRKIMFWLLVMIRCRCLKEMRVCFCNMLKMKVSKA